MSKIIVKLIDPLVKTTFVACDGGCTANGKKNAKAGYGVFFGDNNPLNVSAKVIGKQTNQVAELTAIVKALEILIKTECKERVEIITDSMYSIKCIDVWGRNWMKNGWKTANGKPVQNKELVNTAIELSNKLNVKFVHVKSHKTASKDVNSREYTLWYYNDCADKLATLGINL